MAGDAADINRSIFNEEAASYDNKHRKLNERLTRELQARLDFIGVDWASEDEDSDDNEDENKESVNGPTREVRLLDYACGTGMMSRALAPYTTQCFGMDISEKMVAAYNARAENQGLSPKEMHAIIGDLASPTVDDSLLSSDLFNFDIAVVGGGFHHFGDPELAAKRLVERLKPGVVFLIWDFLPHGPPHRHHHSHEHTHGHEHGDKHNHNHTHEGHGHDVYHSVMHHGFSEERMRDIFTDAGAGEDFKLEVIGGGFVIGHGQDDEKNGDGEEATTDGEKDKNDTDKEGLRRQVFFARGTKGVV